MTIEERFERIEQITAGIARRNAARTATNTRPYGETPSAS
jgi:hypothetical protein